MDEQNQRGSTDRTWEDMDEGLRAVTGEAEEPDDPLRLLSHTRAHPHDRSHVDLNQDEYTPEEAARMLGTSVEVIMRAAYEGELRAERAGSKVVCIKREDLVDWMRRQGPGV